MVQGGKEQIRNATGKHLRRGTRYVGFWMPDDMYVAVRSTINEDDTSFSHEIRKMLVKYLRKRDVKIEKSWKENCNHGNRLNG